MAPTAMTTFFANIGYFLTVLFLVSAVCCVVSGSKETFASGVILGLICLTAWLPVLWNNPYQMAVAHLGILILMLIGIHGSWARAMIGFMLVALIADSVWTMMPILNLSENLLHFPYSLFWWQSILNVLFVFQCIFTMLRCYNSHKIVGKGRDKFYARYTQGHTITSFRR